MRERQDIQEVLRKMTIPFKQVIQASEEANEVFTSFWDTKTGKTAYGEAAPRNAVVFGNDGWRMA